MVTYNTKNCCKSYDGCNLSETRDLPQRGGEQFCACAMGYEWGVYCLSVSKVSRTGRDYKGT